MKSPIGPRPVPRIAKGSGPSGGKAKTMKSYKGVSGSKAPTGSRPVPTIAKNSIPKVPSTGGGRVAVKPTPMKRTSDGGSTAHRNRRGK